MTVKARDTIILIFAALFIGVISAVFLSARYYFHDSKQYDMIWWSAGIFGAMMFAAGFAYGQYCRRSDSRYILGFLYHFIAYAVFNAVWLAMIFIGVSLRGDLTTVIIILIAWGFGVFFHFLLVFKGMRSTIRGMDRNEIFD